MKKIFTFIFTVMVFFAVNGCGSSSKIANDPYAGQGHGESISRDIAREKAYSEAVGEIARKYNREVKESVQREYDSNDRTKGTTSEVLDYRSVLNERSEARLGDIVVKKENTYRVGKKWICDVIVVISPDNIE